MGASFQGFQGIPHQGENQCIVYISPTELAGGRAVPPDVREEPGGALYVHSPSAPPIVLPSTGVKG